MIIRRRCVIFALVGCSAMTFLASYYFKKTDGFSGMFLPRDNEATLPSVNFHAGNLSRQVFKGINGGKGSAVSPFCSLPSLDPFHSSVKSLIVRFEPLDCGTLHSSFENNTIRVKGEDVVSVKYQIVSRKKFDDYGSTLSAPVEIENTNKLKSSNVIKPALTLSSMAGIFFRHGKKTEFSIKQFDINTSFRVKAFGLNNTGRSNEELQRYLKKLSEKNDTATDTVPTCRLPGLDPFHESVKNLMQQFSPLQCGKLHSMFENNTVHVKGENVVAVAYRVISRPKEDDYNSRLSEAISVTNSLQVQVNAKKKPEQKLQPGNTGCIMHKESKKCLHLFGGKDVPDNGEKVVFHSDCCFTHIMFTMTEEKTIKHKPSGYCLQVNNENNQVVLKSECTTKFKVLNGTLQIANSDLCIQSKNHPKLPENDETLEVGKDCKVKFAFYQLPKGESFEGNATVNADFVRVDITRGEGKEPITEVHMQTAPKPEVLQRKFKPAGIPVNIAMIMFDSTSAANFQRQMPKTIEFLKKRPTVYLKGETIVGDGTTAQLCAMLTGIAEEEQPEARRANANAKVVDDWRWVFRDYKKRGYVTMYSEDEPGLGTFNLRLKGFRNPPTDHYGRPFWFEAGKHSTQDYCSTNQPTHKITMKYFLSLFRSYPKNPKFAFLLFSDLTHENMNALTYADKDLVDLLQTMDEESHLDDSIVFIFGDHGVRYGTMRKTLQGKLEERLPHMSITFPTWFPNKYPELYKNVQQNAKLLTTPFDIYVTLQHILLYPQPPKYVKFGQSLLTTIDPQNRTCASSGVEEHWCPCMNLETISVKSSVVKQIANFIVNYINSLLKGEEKSRTLCHQLSLKEIKTAFLEIPNQKVQTFQKSNADHRCDSCGVVLGEKDENNLIKDTLYQVQFITSPNDGFFEASVKLRNRVPSIKGAISRIDTYGNQPQCIQDTHVHLMKFCYCKA